MAIIDTDKLASEFREKIAQIKMLDDQASVLRTKIETVKKEALTLLNKVQPEIVALKNLNEKILMLKNDASASAAKLKVFGVKAF